MNAALEEKATLYEAAGQYADALATLERIRLYQLSVQERRAVLLAKARCSHALEDWAPALGYLEESGAAGDLPSWYAVLLAYNGRYAEAETAALRCCSADSATSVPEGCRLSETPFSGVAASLRPLPLSSSSSLRDNSLPAGPSPCPCPGVDRLAESTPSSATVADSVAVRELFRHTPRERKESAAAWLSLLPPLGQLYLGEPGRGALALLSTAGSAAFVLWQCLDGCWITGLLGGGLLLKETWFDRNLIRNVEAVESVNTARRAAFAGKLAALLAPLSVQAALPTLSPALRVDTWNAQNSDFVSTRSQNRSFPPKSPSR